MYLRTAIAWRLGEPASTCPTGKSPHFSTGGEYIREDDAAKLLAVIPGPSCYQRYIQPLLKSQAASALPERFLRIVSSPKEVPDYLRGRFVTIKDKIVGGTIDRRAGIIYMLPAPGRRIDTRLEFALHEAVHLFAHPFMNLVDEKTFQNNYGRGCSTEPSVGSFQRKYCFGLGEGATQAITEQIMHAQGISKYYHERPYDEFTPPVLELIRIFSLDRFARAYFWGAINEFTQAMEFRWGNSWWNVANLTAAGKTKLALDEINKLEIAFIKRRGPKGDFPSPSPYRSYA